MKIYEMDQLDTLNDAQLWKVASDRHNAAEIRQEAIGQWLFPGETNPDADCDDLGGGRLLELERRAAVLDSDEIDENDTQDAGEMATYFDSQGRLILEHDGMSYLIETLEDDGKKSENEFYTLAANRLSKLEKGHADISSAVVNAQGWEAMHIYEVTIGVYMGSENIAATEKGEQFRAALDYEDRDEF